jgi:hypothetical protein
MGIVTAEKQMMLDWDDGYIAYTLEDKLSNIAQQEIFI